MATPRSASSFYGERCCGRSRNSDASHRNGRSHLITTLHGWHKMVEGWQYQTKGGHWPLLADTVAMGFRRGVVCRGGGRESVRRGNSARAWCRDPYRRTTGLLHLDSRTEVQSEMGGADAQLAALYALVTGTFVLTGGGGWSIDE